jgi:hypothetical protein
VRGGGVCEVLLRMGRQEASTARDPARGAHDASAPWQQGVCADNAWLQGVCADELPGHVCVTGAFGRRLP